MRKLIKIISVTVVSVIILSAYYVYYQENAVMETLSYNYLKSVAIGNADPNHPRPMFIEHIKNNRLWNDSSNQLNDRVFQNLKSIFAEKGIELLHSNQAIIVNGGVSKRGAVFSGNRNLDRWNYGEIQRFGPLKWINPFTIHVEASSYAGPVSASTYLIIVVFKDWKWIETETIIKTIS